MSQPLRIVQPAQADHTRTSWTADELMAVEFPEPRWAVPGIIAEGVSLLAGPPKVGKSWLALGLGVAVASGGRAFDVLPVTAGDVLYLALEDTGRRLQHRLRKLLGGQPAPRRLTLAITCPPLPDGGMEALGSWLDRHPDARLVVIDVLAKIRGRPDAGMSAYDADYATVNRIKALADHYSVAIVAVHHVRKASSEDWLHEVSGTNGLAGAADATLVLKRPRGSADGVLHVTGRDIDETEYALGFHPASGAWQLLDGPPDEHTLPDTRATILRYLRHHPDATPKQIAEATGINYDNAKRTCARMAADGQLAVDAAGRYRTPATGTPVPAPTVPTVPVVPQPPLTSANTGGQQGDSTVPAVPQVPAIRPEEAPR